MSTFHNTSFSVLEEFHPPTHIEILGQKPLRVPIGADDGEDTQDEQKGKESKHRKNKKPKKKWVYEVRLMKAMTYFKFVLAKNVIVKAMDETVEAYSKDGSEGRGRIKLFFHFLKALQLLWDIGEKPLNPWKRFGFKAFFFSHYLSHLDEALQLFEKVLAHSGRIFFLMKCLRSFELMQNEVYRDPLRSPIGPEVFSPGQKEKRDPAEDPTLIARRGFLFSPSAN